MRKVGVGCVLAFVAIVGCGKQDATPPAHTPEVQTAEPAPPPGKVKCRGSFRKGEPLEFCRKGEKWPGELDWEPRAKGGTACKPEDASDCEKQCDAGNAASCTALGVSRLHADPYGAFLAFVAGCEVKDLESCQRALSLNRAPRDWKYQGSSLVSKMEETACQLDDIEMCERSAVVQINFEKLVDDGSLTYAATSVGGKELARMCGSGNEHACERCVTVGSLPRGNFDYAIMQSCWKWACDKGNDEGCTALLFEGHPEWYQSGGTDWASLRAVLARLEPKCKSGSHPTACTQIARLELHRNDVNKYEAEMRQRALDAKLERERIEREDRERRRAWAEHQRKQAALLAEQERRAEEAERARLAAEREKEAQSGGGGGGYVKQAYTCQEQRCIGTAVGNGNRCTSWATIASTCYR